MTPASAIPASARWTRDREHRGRRDRADGPARQRPGAPPAVERVQDRAAVPPLDDDPVGVLRGIHRRVERAQHQEAGREERPRRRQPQPGEQRAEHEPGQDGEPAAADALDEQAGQPARDEPADRHRGHRGTELRVRQAEVRLDHGEPRQDVGDERAVDEEQGTDREPRASGVGRNGRGVHRSIIAYLSYRHDRCLSFPRSRPSRATSGATCCPRAAGRGR